jgi:putative oxidoreductase
MTTADPLTQSAGSRRASSGSGRVVQIFRVALSVDSPPAARDAALLVARLALAWVFVYHGAGTLFGAFGGPGLAREEVFYGTVAHLHPAVFFTVLGGIIECFGGAAVGLGLFGRLAAAAITGDMLMAMVTVTFANGIASSRPGGGYELNLALAALALAVALLGPGRISLDRLVGRLGLHR